jgi:hypothetical protein
MLVRNLSRLAFAFSVGALGVQHIILDHYINTKPPAEHWTDVSFSLIALGYKLCLITLAIALLMEYKIRTSAISMGYLIIGWIFFRHIPLVIQNIRDPAELNSMCMGIALAGGAFVVSDLYTDRLTTRRSHFLFNRSSRTKAFGKFCFGPPMIVFGFQHLLYADFVASEIPAWIPASYFWANATGTALVAAGISILAEVKNKLSTLLLASMIGLWIMVLHLPRVLISPKDAMEWASLLQSVAICASAAALRENIIMNTESTSVIAKTLNSDSSRRTPVHQKRLEPRKHHAQNLSK